MTEPQIGFIQVRCTDMEDYARIFNEGFDEAARQREADVRTAGVRALKEAAVEQRRLAEDSRTNNGHAEHEDIADWLEERADAIPGRPMHCPVGCADGACEICPCCSAGFCVYGMDGLPEDPEDVGQWLEVAAAHNPVAALLKARAGSPVIDREALSLRLQTAQGHRWDHDTTVDAVMELARPMPTVPQLREVLHDQGAYCGDCNYEDWLSCGGCAAVLTRYAQVVLALLKGGQS